MNIMNRKRERKFDDTVYPPGRHRWSPSTTWTNVSYSWTEKGKTETIEDCFEKYGVGIWGMKPMRKVTTTHVAKPYNAHGTVPSTCVGGGNIGKTLDFERCTKYLLSSSAATRPQISADEWAKLAEKLEAKLPSFSNGAPDFLAELAQASQILDLVRSRVIELSVPGAIDLLAKSHLEDRFAIRPLINDIQQFCRRARLWKRHIQNLKAGEHRVLTARVSRTCPVTSTITNTPFERVQCNGASGPCPRGGMVWTVDQTYARLACVCKFTYRMPVFLNRVDEQLVHFQKSFNLDLKAETFWELVPFSFVVDWFFNTDWIFQWLRDLDSDNIKVDVQDACIIERSGRSIVRTSTWPCMAGTSQSSVTSEWYERTLGLDALRARLSGFNWPSDLQWSYGAALSWLLSR